MIVIFCWKIFTNFKSMDQFSDPYSENGCTIAHIAHYAQLHTEMLNTDLYCKLDPDPQQLVN